MKKILFLFALVIVVGGCKKTKYPEGGKYYGAPYTQILGTYTLQKYLVDEVDSTDYYNNVCGRTEYRFYNPNPKFSEYWFEATFFDKKIISYPSDDSLLVAPFELFDENKTIAIGGHTQTLYFQIGPLVHQGNGNKWTIMKLEKNQFIIEIDYLTKHYRVEFLKK